MATISRFRAVCAIGSKIRFSGFIAWLMWLVVHVMYLVGFKNRFTTMVHWAVSFLFRGRSQRTATRQQIVARTLMARLSAAEEELRRVRGDSNGDRPSPEEAEDLEGGTVLAESPSRRLTRPEHGSSDGPAHPPGLAGRRGRTGAVRGVVPDRRARSGRVTTRCATRSARWPGPSGGLGHRSATFLRHRSADHGVRRRAEARSGTGRWTPILVAAVGIGLVGAGSLPGRPDQRLPARLSRPVPQTATGALHELFSTPVFTAPPAAALVLGARFARAGERGWARYSRVTAAVFWVCFVLSAIGFSGVHVAGAHRRAVAAAQHRRRIRLAGRGRSAASAAARTSGQP